MFVTSSWLYLLNRYILELTFQTPFSSAFCQRRLFKLIRRATVLFSRPLPSLFSRIIFQIKYSKESTGGSLELLCFYKRIWCLMFSSMIFFGYSLLVFILPSQLFENFYFGTLKLNSIHISQRFTVDSFGNYASCGQIDFSWGGSWKTVKIEHPHKVLRKGSLSF